MDLAASLPGTPPPEDCFAQYPGQKLGVSRSSKTPSSARTRTSRKKTHAPLTLADRAWAARWLEEHGVYTVNFANSGYSSHLLKQTSPLILGALRPRHRVTPRAEGFLLSLF